MKTHARAVVIGGGVVGVSTLYHLARKGWSDVVLCERTELTAGSTWHAAGLLPLFNMSYSVGQIHKYSVGLYPELERETGQDVGFRPVGNIRLATHRDRMDEYRFYAGVARTIGVRVEFLTPDEVKERWPLCNVEGLVGAIVHPEDGYIQPADLTQAFARGARARGAEIYRRTRVEAIEPTPGGEWRVRTDRGDIVCEHVVSASGNHARQTGAMVGLDVPVIPVEHQYIVTEPHPEIVARREAGLPEMGVLRESDASYYMREERGGLLLGPYERGAPACFVDGPPEDFENDLFPEDLDRLEPHIEAAIRRVPAFGEAGIKQTVNGPIAYTPDGSPLIGPAWDVPRFWLNEGHSFGVTAAGGAGWQLAEWMVEGEPSIDMMGVDPRRFGPYATRGYLKAKNEEAYANVFTIHYPDEERPAGRPLKQSPCYARMQALGAVFGQVYGWERPNWFAPAGVEAKDVWSFRRTNYFEHVGAECRHVHEHVGLLDMTAFAKCEVSGPGAAEWLEGLMANRLPGRDGRIGLCHLLSANGGVRSEFTVWREAADRFYLVSAGAYERHDFDTLRRALPAGGGGVGGGGQGGSGGGGEGDGGSGEGGEGGGVRFEPVTGRYGVFVVAGPQSRELLQPLTDASLADADFPWLSGRTIDLGSAHARALRLNFVGELGWELHHPIEMQNYLFDLLMESARERGLDLRPFGIRAMDSLRLEKSYRLIPRELSIEYAALESGLHRFVHLNKGAFRGRDALVEWQQRGFSYGFATLEVHGVTDADARGSEPIYEAGGGGGGGGGEELVGRATSGGYGWRVGKSLALAMVRPDLAAEGTELEIEILGERRRATVIPESPFDPQNERLRA